MNTSQNYILLIIITMSLIIIYNFYKIYKLEKHIRFVEGFADSEAIANLAKLYDTGNMKVTNLEVTNELTVKGSSTLANTTLTNANVSGKVTAGSGKLGLWEIRSDRIGIPARGDLQIAADKWCRLYDYNANTYAGTTNSVGGFAGMNLWAQSGTGWFKDISTTDNLNLGGTTLSGTHAQALTGEKAFKLFTPSNSAASVCNGGYVISGGSCNLFNGGGSYHKHDNFANDNGRVRFKIVY